jgi:hypothetical protein
MEICVQNDQDIELEYRSRKGAAYWRPVVSAVEAHEPLTPEQ